MRRWTIEVNERELRVILAAIDVARENAPSAPARRWWQETRHVTRLYDRLRDHGLVRV